MCPPYSISLALFPTQHSHLAEQVSTHALSCLCVCVWVCPFASAPACPLHLLPFLFTRCTAVSSAAGQNSDRRTREHPVSHPHTNTHTYTPPLPVIHVRRRESTSQASPLAVSIQASPSPSPTFLSPILHPALPPPPHPAFPSPLLSVSWRPARRSAQVQTGFYFSPLSHFTSLLVFSLSSALRDNIERSIYCLLHSCHPPTVFPTLSLPALPAGNLLARRSEYSNVNNNPIHSLFIVLRVLNFLFPCLSLFSPLCLFTPPLPSSALCRRTAGRTCPLTSAFHVCVSCHLWDCFCFSSPFPLLVVLVCCCCYPSRFVTVANKQQTEAPVHSRCSHSPPRLRPPLSLFLFCRRPPPPPPPHSPPASPSSSPPSPSVGALPLFRWRFTVSL